MTQPVVHGYPDFGLYSAQADKSYGFAQRIGAVANETLGPIFVGDVPALSVKHVASTQPMQLLFRFWVESTLNTELQSHTFNLMAAGNIDCIVPVMGPYLTIDVFNNAFPSTWLLNLASCVGARGSLGVGSAANVLMTQISTPVGAGATVTVDATRAAPGPALLNIDTSLATWLATLSYVTYTGIVTRVDTITQVHAKAPRPVYLNGSAPRFTFLNTTGGAGAFSAHLVVAPMWPAS